MGKHFNKFKRCVSMVLTVAMLLSICNLSLVMSVTAAGGGVGDSYKFTTLGRVMADNYDLSAAEKVIISSDNLSAEEIIYYEAPPAQSNDENKLITVDEDNKKVTVKSFKDTDGNKWIPKSFDLVANGAVADGHDDLALVKDGSSYVGTYAYADNTFSFLRLMSEQEPLENISVRNVRGGCYYLGVQMQISPYVREKESAKGQRGVGKLKNITLSDWRIYHRQPYGMDIDWQKRADASVDGMIDMEEMVENLTIDHFVREHDKDNRPDLPTLYIKNDVENRIELIGADNTLLKLDGQEYQGRFILKETTPADGITELYGDIDYLHFE